MFKVHENGDGSTSIFCSKTGRLICKIGSQQKNMGLGCRPANVVESSSNNRSCCYNIEANVSQDSQDGSDEERSNIKIDEEPPLPIWDETEEDIGECLTTEELARCLNLIPTEKLKNQKLDELKSTFPLRFISRTKALPSDARFPDELPITSSLGLKVLKTNIANIFVDDNYKQAKLRSYENFCRFQINSSYVFNHPNLRCRDKKEYPVVFSSKNSKFATAHYYAYNRTQRMENLITFKTGLNTRSRKLLLKCNKRLAVSIKRLPDEEIKRCMQKRARLGPIPPELIKGEETSLTGSDSESTVIVPNNSAYVDIDLYSDESSEPNHYDDDDPPYKCTGHKKTNFRGVLSSNLSTLRNRNGQSSKQFMSHFQIRQTCSVVLQNVLHDIRKCRGDYYVNGTNIQVPFLKNYLSSLDPRTRHRLVFPEVKLIINPKFMTRHDHAYHRPFSTIDDKKQNLLSNSNCLNHKNPKTKINFKNTLKGNSSVKSKSLKKTDSLNSSNSITPNISKGITNVAIIPIIDLTLSPPNSPMKAIKGNCPFYTFRCYGCDYNIKTLTEADANGFATQHLKVFHCVSDPKSFLSVNNSPSGIVLEAFPGYRKEKESVDQ